MTRGPRPELAVRTRLGLVVFGVAIALAAVLLVSLALREPEWATYHDPARDDVRPTYMVDDAELGYAPKAGQTVRARREIGGRLVYDVLYTIDDDGLRATPGDPSAPGYLFFGDSCTFGEGIGDDDTLPARFADELGRPANVRNLGFHGYGPHQAVRALETGRVDALVPGGVAHAFFESLPSHAARVAGRTTWDVDGPSYVLDDASPGGVRHVGAFHSPAVAGLLRAVNRLPPLRWLRERVFFATTDDDRELHARLLARAAALVRERHGAPLTVLHWDDGSPEDERFLARLRELRVDVVRVSDVMPAERRDAYAIPLDGHPTREANALLARALARRSGS